jgi:glycerophosphoryl diester phosphodiesterase
MIDLVRGKAGIIPETKAPEAYGRRGLNMEQAVMEVLKSNGLDTPGADPKTPVVIQSFSAESLKALRGDCGCRLPLVVLAAKKDTSPDGLKAVRQFADGVAPNKADVLARPEMVAQAHALGKSVTVWTFRPERNGRFNEVRDELAYFLRDLQVDAVFTDCPDQFPRD